MLAHFASVNKAPDAADEPTQTPPLTRGGLDVTARPVAGSAKTTLRDRGSHHHGARCAAVGEAMLTSLHAARGAEL